jgi:hypothetical protein
MKELLNFIFVQLYYRLFICPRPAAKAAPEWDIDIPGMIARGYKAKLIREKPLKPGWVRAAAPVIRESSLNIAAHNPAMKKVLGRLSGTFIFECKRQKIAEKHGTGL